MRITGLNRSLQSLKEKCDEMSRQVQVYEQNKAVQVLLSIFAAADRGNKYATFMKHQVMSFGKTTPCYEEEILSELVHWKACASKAHKHVKGQKRLKLPCRSTLQKYVGFSAGEVGVICLIKDRQRSREALVSHY